MVVADKPPNNRVFFFFNTLSDVRFIVLTCRLFAPKYSVTLVEDIEFLDGNGLVSKACFKRCHIFFCLYIKKRPWPLSLDQSILLGKCSSPVLAIKQTELFFWALWSDFVVHLFH